MSNFQKIVVLLTTLSVGLGLGGYLFYRQAYRKPRAALAEERLKLETQIESGKKMGESIDAATQQLSTLYTRSFPYNPTNSSLEYQRWLTQLLDFCNIQDASVQAREYSAPRNAGLATQKFGIQARCSLLDLTRFLYEFYWTPFLHRISALDIQTEEGSDFLKVSITLEGLTILMRAQPNQEFPLADKLPLSVESPRQLASGPFATYEPLGGVDLFRAVKTGVDHANFATLTGTPTITDENGSVVKFSRWKIESEGRSMNLKIGERLSIGSFDAIVADVSDDLVVLRQNNGRVWVVPLGFKLNEAVAVPPNLF